MADSEFAENVPKLCFEKKYKNKKNYVKIK